MAEKSKGVAAVLCLFLGTLGIHRFYLGRIGGGVAQLIILVLGWFTTAIMIGWVLLGVLGTWVLIDFIMILTGALVEKSVSA